jgi:hypothetical protein
MRSPLLVDRRGDGRCGRDGERAARLSEATSAGGSRGRTEALRGVLGAENAHGLSSPRRCARRARYAVPRMPPCVLAGLGEATPTRARGVGAQLPRKEPRTAPRVSARLSTTAKGALEGETAMPSLMAGRRFVVSCLHCRRVVTVTARLATDELQHLRVHLLVCCPRQLVKLVQSLGVDATLRHFRVEPAEPDDEPPPHAA